MQKIFLVGVSGSIGKNVRYCIKEANRFYKESNQLEKMFSLVGIMARSNLNEIKQTIEEFSNQKSDELQELETIVCTDPKNLKILRQDYPHINCYDNIKTAIENTSFDILVNALIGSIGLQSTVLGIEKKAKILLANKESLVMAGEIINQLLKKHQTSLIPIDSEHSAIFQLINKFGTNNINKVILTASGGPFLNNYKENPSIEEALNHPNWKMGKKITIDSATMMNKGLEVIETHYLFDLPYKNIEVIIHPQSIVHSLVETIDGEEYAQLGSADMRHPIFNALTYPAIIPNQLKKFSLYNHPKLDFIAPNFEKFPMLKLAYECGEKGGNYPMVMNAVNEKAVHLFLDGKISFKEIYQLNNEIVSSYQGKKINEIEDIINLDLEIKIKTEEKIKN